jgi:hypothetical protein
VRPKVAGRIVPSNCGNEYIGNAATVANGGGMSQAALRHSIVVVAHALVGWGVCMATMGLAMAVTGLHAALIIRAIAALIIFTEVSAWYFARFAYTPPLTTAIAFVAVVVFLDVVIVAMLARRSFEMFGSFASTWLPFALIFGSTYITGMIVHPPSNTEHASE